jgi:hypothetical protein
MICKSVILGWCFPLRQMVAEFGAISVHLWTSGIFVVLLLSYKCNATKKIFGHLFQNRSFSDLCQNLTALLSQFFAHSKCGGEICESRSTLEVSPAEVLLHPNRSDVSCGMKCSRSRTFDPIFSRSFGSCTFVLQPSFGAFCCTNSTSWQ